MDNRRGATKDLRTLYNRKLKKYSKRLDGLSKMLYICYVIKNKLIMHFNYFIQDNQLYDANTHDINQFDDGILHRVEGVIRQDVRTEECHGIHYFIDTEIDVTYGETIFVKARTAHRTAVMSQEEKWIFEDAVSMLFPVMSDDGY